MSEEKSTGDIGFDELVDALNKHAIEIADWVNKNNDMKSVVAMEVLLKVRQKVMALEPTAKLLSKLHDDLKKRIVPAAFERDGVRTITDNQGVRATVQSTIYASVVSGMMGNAQKWLRDNGYRDLIKETVNASSLSSLAREMAQGNEELPDELFHVHVQPNTLVTFPK